MRSQFEKESYFEAVTLESERVRLFKDFLLALEESCGHNHQNRKKQSRKHKTKRSRSRSPNTETDEERSRDSRHRNKKKSKRTRSESRSPSISESGSQPIGIMFFHQLLVVRGVGSCASPPSNRSATLFLLTLSCSYLVLQVGLSLTSIFFFQFDH